MSNPENSPDEEPSAKRPRLDTSQQRAPARLGLRLPRRSPLLTNSHLRPATETFVPHDANIGLCPETVQRTLNDLNPVANPGIFKDFRQELISNKFFKGSNHVVTPAPISENFDDKNDTSFKSKMGTDYDDSYIFRDDDEPKMVFPEDIVPVHEVQDPDTKDEKTSKVKVTRRILTRSATANPPDEPYYLGGPDITDPIITQDMMTVTTDFLKRPIEDQTLEIANTRIVNGELGEIKDDNWLTDSIIDYYMQLILSREPVTTRSRIYCFQSVFYKLLSSSEGLSKVDDTATDLALLSDYDYLYIPAWANHHWRLIVVNVQTRTIKSYNSQAKADVQIMNNVERYLKHEQVKSFPELEGVVDDWNKVPSNSELIPQQDNCNDCGVFLLVFANYLSQEKAFNFSQDHMMYFRERILYECVTQQLF